MSHHPRVWEYILAALLGVAATFHIVFDPLISAVPAIILALLSVVIGWQWYQYIQENTFEIRN